MQRATPISRMCVQSSLQSLDNVASFLLSLQASAMAGEIAAMQQNGGGGGGGGNGMYNGGGPQAINGGGGGSMAASAASLGLNWNPKHLEIKTRTVEKTLEPLVMQVTRG